MINNNLDKPNQLELSEVSKEEENILHNQGSELKTKVWEQTLFELKKPTNSISKPVLKKPTNSITKTPLVIKKVEGPISQELTGEKKSNVPKLPDVKKNEAKSPHNLSTKNNRKLG